MFSELMARLYQFAGEHNLELEIFANNDTFRFTLYGMDRAWGYAREISYKQMEMYRPNYLSYIHYLIEDTRKKLFDRGVI